MNNLVLFPATGENLATSIYKHVPLDFASEFLPSEQFKKLKTAIDDANNFYCWAVTKTRRYVFNQLSHGDQALFNERGSGTFNLRASIRHKFHNLQFGKRLWPVAGGNDWEFIFVIGNISSINVGKRCLLSELSYSNKFDLPGVMVVNDERKQLVIKKHGSFDNLLRYCS